MARSRSPEKGAVVPVAAVVLLLVLGFCGLAMNAGHKSVARKELQNGIDAAAMAGAGALDGTSRGVGRAPFRARALARQNEVWRQRLDLNGGDAIPGYWDQVGGTFSGIGETIRIGRASIVLSTSQPQYFNAVRVEARADGDGHHPLVQTIFWTPTGNPCLDVHGSAVGVGGGPCEDDSGCTLPIVLPSCAMTDGSGATVCGTVQTIYFNHGQGKDAALANIVDPSGSVNNNTERSQMAAGAACTNPRIDVGQDVPLGNGNDFNNQVERAMRQPNNIVCSGGAAPYDNCPHEQLPIAYVADCSRPMNHSAPTVGFARVVVLDTNPGGADASVTVYIDCTARSTSSSAGCAHFGYAAFPHLAQ